MDWGGPAFIIAIIVTCTAGWLINNWIRARHGYALEDEWGGKTERADVAATAELRRESDLLKQRLAALESRAATLEAIITDRGFDVAHQIEALREPRNEVIRQ
ncbi:hypothetical protein [Novosphingobium album (ex Liu et al. 2023)]|uniref:Envelope stress response membrane protein PspB n=1 Tax=Novosphingobium album (ex Liu et al. 2023) TaxID=3031130 RepID=A0ABT5WSQ1_9SPHN|nr:hypothetical protein [Novosphingobium album (ex Liu et al. 2023)]MDE8653078.1 hypothetical protein [Novosphingobium album (ex Liu et al. 2023)]